MIYYHNNDLLITNYLDILLYGIIRCKLYLQASSIVQMNLGFLLSDWSSMVH